YPLMLVVEKAFGFISNVTLIELSNTSKDLLRRLSETAPGTFQHSLMVGNLAAEIANKIDAKAQLVRTGAMYHDIGKMLNPACYTENQFGDNILDNMPRIEAAQVVISHVTDGLKLADKYNLPGVIKDFINTHHGTGKAKYFYVSYKNENPDKPVDESLFTYPGTDPFTREQAILMMADTVEAASRSLDEYTEESISKLVNRLIDQQVEEGFFRYCPITFHDIAVAKQVLTERLMSIYHTRTVYPELKKQ
ncbi:MAG: HDIG domain-containing metalloprotein, partial [Prevotella sp.]